MDDTMATSHLEDVRFTFEYLSKHGPPLGLNLHQAKCEILLSTNGDPGLASLPPALQADLRWAADTYCKGNLATDGIMACGVPLGSAA